MTIYWGLILKIWALTSLICLSSMFLYIYTTTIKVYNALCDFHEDTKYEIPPIFQFNSLIKVVAGWPLDAIKLAVFMVIPGLNFVMLAIMAFQKRKTADFFIYRIISAIGVAEKMRKIMSQFDNGCDEDITPPDM